jgi:HlyD family secretion protein
MPNASNFPSFTRVLLPLMAVGALALSVFLIARNQPDRAVVAPAEQPANAGSLAQAGVVAGSGVIEPSSEIIGIGSHLSGVVESVSVTPGQRVQAGQILFLLDTRAVVAELNESQAQLRRANAVTDNARAALTTALAQLKLYRSVEDDRAISAQERIAREGVVDEARTRVALAQAEAESAKAQLQRVEVRQKLHSVTAPIAATVLSVDVRPGEFVQAGGQQGSNATRYMELGQTEPLHVRIDIDEDEAIRLQPGATAVITPRGDANRKINAAFVRTEPLMKPKRSLTNSASERVDVRVMQLIYKLPPEASDLVIGQQTDAFIPALSAVVDTGASTSSQSP